MLPPKKCLLISSSKKVGEDMRDWFISGDDHRWTIKLDVRDLGGHLDATNGARNAALARRAVGLLDKVPAVGALPLGFGGKLRILRAMHTPAALHGVEASHIFQASLKRLRAAYVRAVTSGSMHLANPGAVWSRWMGLQAAILVVVFSGAGFVCCHGTWLTMLGFGICFVCMVFFGLFAPVLSGHGPIHVLLHGAAEIGFSWDPVACVWTGVASSLPDCKSFSVLQVFFSGSLECQSLF